MSTDHRAMMLCDYGVKAGMAEAISTWINAYMLQVKLCDPDKTRALEMIS